MITLPNKYIAALVIGCSTIFGTMAKAYDASVDSFEWISPQTLKTDTGQVKYSFHFKMSPSYPVTCKYDEQLYLSKDQTLSGDDFALFDPIQDSVPAGVVGFNATVTRYFYEALVLPCPAGTYYVLLKITPGQGAPSDTNSANNVAMAPNPIQVEGRCQPTVLTAATVVTSPTTGQSMVVAGYSDSSGKGSLKFLDWQGNVLASQNNLGNVTAMATGLIGSPPTPRLFVASSDSGGALHAIDLTNIGKNLASRVNLGRINAIEVGDEATGSIYLGKDGGTLHKLNGVTLSDQFTRPAMGNVTALAQMRSAWGDVLAVGSTNSNGSVYFVDKDTLGDAVMKIMNLNTIYALSSADMDLDGFAELAIASSANGGSIQFREGPTYVTNLGARTNLGEIYTLDYGHLGTGPCSKQNGSAWLLFASSQEGGSLNSMCVDVGPSAVTLSPWTKRAGLGNTRYAQLHDFYAAGVVLAGAIWEKDEVTRWQVMDDTLGSPKTSPVNITSAPMTEDDAPAVSCEEPSDQVEVVIEYDE